MHLGCGAGPPPPVAGENAGGEEAGGRKLNRLDAARSSLSLSQSRLSGGWFRPEATSWPRAAEGGEARCVAALLAPQPAARGRREGHGATGPRASAAGAGEPGSSRGAPPARGATVRVPVLNARLFGVRRWLVVGHNASERPRRGGGGEAVESDGGFVRFVCRASPSRAVGVSRQPGLV